jgi:hypothetical protein
MSWIPSSSSSFASTGPTSLMSPLSREGERERLEGSLLSVCTDCKDMVLQVRRRHKKRKWLPD